MAKSGNSREIVHHTVLLAIRNIFTVVFGYPDNMYLMNIIKKYSQSMKSKVLDAVNCMYVENPF